MSDKECAAIVEEMCEGPRMTYEARERIFAKEVLTISDISVLCGLSYQAAAALIRNVRRRCDRLGLEGKLHVQDYLDYFELNGDSERYNGRRGRHGAGYGECGDCAEDHVEDPFCRRGTA